MKKTTKKILVVPAVGAMLCSALTLHASARLEADPQYGDVIVMFAETRSDIKKDSGDPLCNVINERREAAGSVRVACNEDLMARAAERVEEMENGGDADASTLGAADASEIVVFGKADINTMLCSILLSPKQSRNLMYTGYTQFGYACNEENTVWVLLMTS